MTGARRARLLRARPRSTNRLEAGRGVAGTVGPASSGDALGRRIRVVGCPGAGKTTLARALAARLGLEHIELDAMHHQPGWVPLERDEFRRRLAQRLHRAEGGWVVCGNYNSKVGDLVQERADTLIVLDLSRAVVVRRVIARTLRRLATRQELWNGNREPLSNLFRWDPEHNIIRWAWVHHPRYRDQYRALVAEQPPGVRTLHLSRAEHVDALLANVPPRSHEATRAPPR